MLDRSSLSEGEDIDYLTADECLASFNVKDALEEVRAEVMGTGLGE